VIPDPLWGRQAWTELVTRLDQVLDWVIELDVEAAVRMARSGKQPIPATVGLGGFRSPKASELTMPGMTRQPD
jgi:hypothetical protein